MKRDGFIATSLIYSFFLVFIAIIAALLGNFIANKTILDRFNSEVMNDLNSDTYTVIVTSKTANIINGMTLTNLISNGRFENGKNFWESNPKNSSNFSIAWYLNNNSLFKNNNGTSNLYMYQNIYLIRDSKYYYSIEYAHNSSAVLNTYIEDISKGAIKTINNSGYTWTRGSQIYNSTYDGNVRFIIGNSGSTSYTGNSYFTKAMVINLTASFGSGYEPDKEWVDDNIDYFDGTTNYIRLADIEANKSVSVRFNPHNNFTRSTVKCSDDAGGPTPVYTTQIEIIDGRVYGNFEIPHVTSNIHCEVEWSA